MGARSIAGVRSTRLPGGCLLCGLGQPASYDLIEVYPGKGFIYSMAAVEGIENRRYYVAERPYCKGQ